MIKLQIVGHFRGLYGRRLFERVVLIQEGAYLKGHLFEGFRYIVSATKLLTNQKEDKVNIILQLAVCLILR